MLPADVEATGNLTIGFNRQCDSGPYEWEGRLYGFFQDIASEHIEAAESTDGGLTWTLDIDSVGRPPKMDSACEVYTTFREGDSPIAWVAFAGVGRNINFTRFHLDTGLWHDDNENGGPVMIAAASLTGDDDWPALHMHYQASRERLWFAYVDSTNRCKLAYYDFKASSWTSGISIGDTVSFSATSPVGLLRGAVGRIHLLFWGVPIPFANSSLNQITISEDATVGTIETVYNFPSTPTNEQYFSDTHLGIPGSFEIGDDRILVVPVIHIVTGGLPNEGYVHWAVSADSPSWSRASIQGSHPTLSVGGFDKHFASLNRVGDVVYAQFGGGLDIVYRAMEWDRVGKSFTLDADRVIFYSPDTPSEFVNNITAKTLERVAGRIGYFFLGQETGGGNPTKVRYHETALDPCDRVGGGFGSIGVSY
jgi:hypothetical protein